MVERLKIAIDKARAQRAKAKAEPAAGSARKGFLGMQTAPAAAPAPEVPADPAAPPAPDWSLLEEVALDPRHLEKSRVITHARKEPAHVAFDVLRTRIMRAFQKHGWSRLGITSPTKACGKTFTATNLGLSLSRQADCRTILMDMDLRAPTMARALGVAHPEAIEPFLQGDVTARDYLRRIGDNLAVGLNAQRVRNAAEAVQAHATARALETMQRDLAPDIVVYDLPPLLSCDDVIGFLPQLDCVLLVVGGGRTRPSEVTECERLLADQTQLLGVLLNQAEDAASAQYGYS